MLKAEYVLDGSSPEFIYTLVIVADNAYIVVPRGKHGCQNILCVVGILIFVHHDVMILVAIILKHLGKVAQKLDGIDYYVVKIHRVCGFKLRLILCICVRNKPAAAIIRARGSEILG